MTTLPLSRDLRDSLLGFMGAVGVLSALDRAHASTEPRLHWEPSAGHSPVLTLRGSWAGRDVVRALHDVLLGDATAWHWSCLGDSLRKVTPEQFRATVSAAPDQRALAYVGAFGAIRSDASFAATVLDTLDAGRMEFFRVIRGITTATSEDQIRRALFEPWDYADDGPTMRWDPTAGRRWAHLASDPAGTPLRTMRGANRLAIEALRCWPIWRPGRTYSEPGAMVWAEGRPWIEVPLWGAPMGFRAAQALIQRPADFADRMPVRRAPLVRHGYYRSFGDLA